MLPWDADQQLSDWIARRLDPNGVSADELQRLQSLLDATPGTPFTAAEIARILAKARGDIPLGALQRHAPPHTATPSLLRFGHGRLRRYALIAGVAAAACLLLVLGVYLWQALWSGPDPGPGGPSQIAQQTLPAGSTVSLLDGQAILRVTAPDTRFGDLKAAEQGRVRLDQGSVYLEMFPQMGLEVEVQTAFGTVTATDSRAYLHCPQPDRDGKAELAVLVVEGQVEITNSLGYEIAEAGEVLVVKAGADPDRIGPDPYFEENRDWTQAQEVIQLLQNPEVHDQLKLPALMREKFNRPVAEEGTRAGALFVRLADTAVTARPKEVAGFFIWHADQMTALLDASQKKQFRQLHLQQVGLIALAHRDVIEELHLSPQQHQQINTHLKKFCTAQKNLFVHGSGTSFDLTKAMNKLQQERDSALLKVLKPQQKQQWEKMAPPPPSFGKIGQHVNMGLKGVSFNMLSFQSKSEEQLWDLWLQQTAKRAKMSPTQLAEARDLLKIAKKDAADYRTEKSQDFKQLADESISMLKSKKPDWQGFQMKVEKLQLPVAEIGQDWKEAVLDLLTADQRKSMEQSSQKELPPWLDAIWKGAKKPPGPGKGSKFSGWKHK